MVGDRQSHIKLAVQPLQCDWLSDSFGWNFDANQFSTAWCVCLDGFVTTGSCECVLVNACKLCIWSLC